MHFIKIVFFFRRSKNLMKLSSNHAQAATKHNMADSSPQAEKTDQPDDVRNSLNESSNHLKNSQTENTLSPEMLQCSITTSPTSDATSGLIRNNNSQINQKQVCTKKLSKHKNGTNGYLNNKYKLAKARERRATSTIAVLVLAFIICWVPFSVVYLIDRICLCGLQDGPWFAVMFWMGYCNSAVNPILYSIFNRDFRKAFNRLLSRRKRYHWCQDCQHKHVSRAERWILPILGIRQRHISIWWNIIVLNTTRNNILKSVCNSLWNRINWCKLTRR